VPPERKFMFYVALSDVQFPVDERGTFFEIVSMIFEFKPPILFMS
jgi:hypothetical protein